MSLRAPRRWADRTPPATPAGRTEANPDGAEGAASSPTVAVDRGGARLWLVRHHALLLLVAAVAGLAAGAALHAAGAVTAGDRAWDASGALGAAYSLWTMVDALRRRRIGVDLIALLALLGALAVAEHLAAAVISVMLASGRSLEAWAAGRARRDLEALLQRAPRVAHRYTRGGIETVAVADVGPGDLLLVGTGELVPVDGNLVRAAVLDESALTGESLPVEREAHEAVRSGVVNAGPPLDLLATADAGGSTYAGIVRLVAEAEASRPPFVRLADRYALGFLALTLVGAGAAWAAGGAARAVAVLVVATPCPLILAAPVALIGGLSQAARRGVVVKDGGVLERLAGCTTLLFDKTGTLTLGRPRVVAVVPAGTMAVDELLSLAASLDQVSAHVLASAVVRAAESRGCRLELPSDVEEIAGQGVRGLVGHHRVAIGKAGWVGVDGAPAWAKSARRRARLEGALTVFVAADGAPAGVLILEDPLRADAARTIRALRAGGIDRVVMVTGDRREVAETVGAVLEVDAVAAERSPEEKLDVVRSERASAPSIMVGDGINDAPALALADVGVAMGARGATVSSEAADVVVMLDRLDRLGEVRAVAVRTRRIAVQSVVAGMAMSLVAMGVAAVGWLPAVWGALLQEGIDVAVILNALRALRPVADGVRLDGEGSALARQFESEHDDIRAVVDRLRSVADGLRVDAGPGQLVGVRALHRQLVDVVVPHEEAEDRLLYPMLDRVIGGTNPTGPMSREHVEIRHQVRRLGQLLEEVDAEGCDAEEIVELRRLLYGLHAVLRLHTSQEDESYLSLRDDEVLGPEPRADLRM